MRKEETVPVLEAALKPLLLEAGFKLVGGRWTSRRGDAILSVDFSAGFRAPVLRAGIGFVPALHLLQTAPPQLDLSFQTLPASDLLQLYLSHGILDSHAKGKVRSGPSWLYEGLTADTLAESARVTFRVHILPFFEATSRVEAALKEVEEEGRYGDCGPLSWYQPRINKFFLAALYKQRGDRKLALEVVEKELPDEAPAPTVKEFRNWILRP